MKDIGWYWDNKSERANTAQAHTITMSMNYEKEIEHSIRETITYGKDTQVLTNEDNINRYDNTEIIVCQEDSVSAILKFNKDKTAVLNFASYKNPGGGFMNGSRAQEESLCHESFLYNVLRRYNNNYYNWNNTYKNRGLYFNRALYSPKVCFEREDEKCFCDVITCAAPNYTTASKYCHVSKNVNSRTLRSRIDFVLSIAAKQQVNTLILGAFGCGVFGQDATEVASIFKERLTTKYKKTFKNVYFAVPVINDDSTNYDAFVNVFNE